MPSLGMSGPYALKADIIDKQVSSIKCGNYALGHRKQSDNKFVVCHVGRSDTDVNDVLKKWVGETKQPLFKYSYATSLKDAFEKECNNFHDFYPRDNSIHPDLPTNSGWKCPRCGIYDDKKNN